MTPLIGLGTKTRWGPVSAVGMIEGERYYWMIKAGVVSMMPAPTVEESLSSGSESKAN